MPAATWSPYQPDAARPWNLPRAGHLYRRAGFGGNWNELQRALAEGPQKTLDRLLRPSADVAAFNREQDGFETNGPNALPVDELRGWWLRRMITTPHPLLEKMTLFWHGWFGVSNARVNNPLLVLTHVRTLRAHALGKLDALLAAMVRDPAVLLAAGGADNRRFRPNETLARHMLAEFTVGEGAFSDRDVKEVARAFTGFIVRGGQLRDIPREHDDGSKTIFGQTGAWKAEDFARLALKQPALHRRVVRAVYRWLISEEQEPSGDLVEPLARSFGADYDVGKLVSTMLRSEMFFAPQVFQRRMKSPVEFAVGLARAMETTVPTLRLGRDLAELGQDLYHPPTLKGWAGGRAWINKATLIGRTHLASALLSGSGGYEQGMDAAAVALKHAPAADAGRFLADLLLQTPFAAGAARNLRAVAASIAASPEYQLA